jgi:predicted MFS family arabinose efflux permease
MFLQYAVPGALVPLFTVHLEHLGFGPRFTADCCTTQAVASILTPLVVGQVADRWFAAERCLGVCAALAGVVLWVLADLTVPWAVLAATMLFWLLAGPILLLGTTVCFAHLDDPEQSYGGVRLWGTVGWVVPGWLLLAGHVTGWSPQVEGEGNCAALFRLGAVFAFALALYTFWLPHTPPRRIAARRWAPLAALRLLAGPSFFTFCACTAGVWLIFPFTSQATPLLLQDLGLRQPWLNPTLTLAQASEVAALALLPMFLLRLGVRGTMLLGLGAWLAALCVLSVGRPVGLVIGSLVLNGLCVSGVLVAGQVFVNHQAHGDLRASVQALLTFVNGVGMLLGHQLVGVLRERNNGSLPRTFAFGAAVTGCLVLLFLAGFRDRPAPAPQPAGQEG